MKHSGMEPDAVCLPGEGLALAAEPQKWEYLPGGGGGGGGGREDVVAGHTPSQPNWSHTLGRRERGETERW